MSLDYFKGTGFDIFTMTASIAKAPYQPGIIGAMNLFKKEPVITTAIEIVRKGGKLSLLPTRPRGAKGTVNDDTKAKARLFKAPHIPHDDTIIADALQNVRDWESEDSLIAVSKVVNARLDTMRQNHETTHEYHRIGAIKGTVLDADGATTIYDMYSEFGISQQSVDFTLGTSTTNIKGKIEAGRRLIETALGGTSYNGLMVLAGDTFWDKFVDHDKTVKAWERFQDGSFLRESQRAKGFEFGNVFWNNYRGKIGTVDFIGASDAYLIPLGIPDLFMHYMAPGTSMQAVNSPGQEIYASQYVLPHDVGVEIHTESNPLMICTRPEAIIKLTTSN